MQQTHAKQRKQNNMHILRFDTFMRWRRCSLIYEDEVCTEKWMYTHAQTHTCMQVAHNMWCACMCEWGMHIYISGAFEHVQRTGFWLNVSYACIMLVYNSWNELCMIVREVSCHFASYYQWSYSCVLYAYRWLPQKKKAPGNSPDR